jgi:hypothetical protein
MMGSHCAKHLLMKIILAKAVATSLLASNAYADSWSFGDSIESEVITFDELESSLVTDATRSSKYPDFSIEIASSGVMMALYRGIYVDKIFSDKQKRYFLGLNNKGFSNIALVLFDNRGTLIRILYHDEIAQEYCKRSSYVQREWVSLKEGNVIFTYNDSSPMELKDIALTSCGGETLSLNSILLLQKQQK